MASQLRRRSRESAEQVVRLVQAVSCSSSSQQQQLHSSLQGLGTQHLLFSPPHHSCLGSWNWGSCRHLGFAAAAHAQLRPDVQQRSLEQQPASAGDTSLNFRLKVITGTWWDVLGARQVIAGAGAGGSACKAAGTAVHGQSEFPTH